MHSNSETLLKFHCFDKYPNWEFDDGSCHQLGIVQDHSLRIWSCQVLIRKLCIYFVCSTGMDISCPRINAELLYHNYDKKTRKSPLKSVCTDRYLGFIGKYILSTTEFRKILMLVS